MSLLTAPAAPAEDRGPDPLLRRRSLSLPLSLAGLAAWPAGYLLMCCGVGRFLDAFIWAGVIGLAISVVAGLAAVVELVSERHLRGRVCAGGALVLAAAPWAATAWALGAFGLLRL